ncbi:UvrD-helicase domain-containing protein [Micromonospora taraxaci]|uniref:UvrD-helicase domain-containing protein n=1 Tax=Micromonospora taraxaci TaxID=1316803 RepID=UPI0033BEAD79
MPLSEEQRRALWDDDDRPLNGLRILSARPGTGKTTTVTSYCLDLARSWRDTYAPWQGIAVLSYTNVAKEEVQARIRSNGSAHVLLRNPHFLGTLDAFINQHLFLPHGARQMGYAEGRPRLVGEPYEQWKSSWKLHNSSPNNAFKPSYFDCYTLDINGDPLRIDSAPRIVQPGRTAVAPAVSASNTSKILAMKQYVWSHGMSLQTDANFLAYQVIKTSMMIARSMARRFPVLIVDEAQDMTEIQHGIIDLLIDAGLRNVVLVGDQNQAIYEWNTARPDLFTSRMTAEGWQGGVLKESHRCGTPICATLTAMAADGVTLTPRPNAKNSLYSTPVNIRLYDLDDQQPTVREAIDAAAEGMANLAPHDGNANGLKSLAVITRSGEDARRLQAHYTGIAVEGAHRTVWSSPLTRRFLKVVHHLSQRETEQAVRAYEQLLCRAGEHVSTEEARIEVSRRAAIGLDDVVAYRVLLLADLSQIAFHATGQLPRISDCAAFADLPLAALKTSHRTEIRRDCFDFTDPSKAAQDRLLSALFAAREERAWFLHPTHPQVRLFFATTHAVKGETHDAVVFYTKHRILRCDCPESSATWKAVLQHSILECETKRIAYVACSRAAQTLTVLTPVESLAAWQALTGQ